MNVQDRRRLTYAGAGVALLAAVAAIVIAVSGADSAEETTTAPPEVTAEPASTPGPTSLPQATAIPTAPATAISEPSSTEVPDASPTETPEPEATALPAPSPTAVPTPTATPVPPRSCQELLADPATAEDGLVRLLADVDGDGVDETVLVDRPPGGTDLLYVCESNTLTLEPWNLGSGNKPARVQAIDVEGDGTDELLVGGPTGSAPLAASVVVLRSGGFEWVPLNLTVRPPLAGATGGETFGCSDTTGDGVPELVDAIYEFTGGTTLTTATGMAWSNSAGQVGQIPLPSGTADAWLFASGTCGDVVTVPLALPSSISAVLSAWFEPGALGTLTSNEAGVQLGLGNELIVNRTTEELASPAGWVIESEGYNGQAGPFSALDVLDGFSGPGGEVSVKVGRQDHCASPPIEPPTELDGLLQISIQPTWMTSCLEWFAVNLFVNPDLSLVAVTLELWEP